MVEYKINKLFTLNGVKLKPIEAICDYLCLGCYFEPELCDMRCKRYERGDFKNVIFKEKVK